MADYYSEKMNVLSMENDTPYKKTAASPHMLFLDNRQMGTISGVIDVIAFHDREILLKTVAGTMTIRGIRLTLTRLDLEKKEADVQGEVDSILYSRKRSRTDNYKNTRSWFEKMRSWW